MVEINFLCVHKSLRGKRLAPVLIREVTRRVNVTDVWQAVYTAGVVLPSPIGQCRYYHRSLDPKKLIDVGFSYLKKNMTMAMTLRANKLPDQPQLPGLRPMQAQDMVQVHALLTEHLAKFKLTIEFTLEETRHWLLCAEPDVVVSYVVAEGDTVTDFFSFYNLPSSIIGNAKHTTLRAGKCSSVSRAY
jgi:glycylpeptide N-tetradecanoyltransferase